MLTMAGCAQNNNYQQLELVKASELKAHSKEKQMAASQRVESKPKGQKAIQRKKIGIAFGGGGIRGYMHLGVIKALEESKIKADIVTGSSAGSIAATLYASGKTYDELEKIISDFSETDIMDIVLSRKGIMNGQNLAQWINNSVPQQKLSDMVIPIGITATDMTSLESVLIRDGNPGEAVQTSSTIPGAFIPVEHKDHLLVDGGVLNVVPVDYAKAMGADLVIAVDIYCGNQKPAKNTSLSMQLSTFRLLACKLSEAEINRADIVIRPDYEPDENRNFNSKKDAINAGYKAMMAQMPKLEKLLKEL